MPHTMTELEKMPTKKAAYFRAWKGAKGICMRIAKEERSWYFRGVIKHPHHSEPFQMLLGLSNLRSMTSKFLEEESTRLRNLCKQGIDPRLGLTVQPVDPTTPTLGELWPTYLGLKKNLKQGYLDDIDGKWKRSCDLLHGLKPEEATTVVVSKLFDGFLEKDLVSTAHHIKRILRPFFLWIRRRHPTLPLDLLDFELPKVKPQQARLSDEEVPKFGKMLLEGHGNYSYGLKWNVVFLMLTGCRASFLVHWKKEWIRETPKGAFFDIPPGTPDLKDAEFVLITPQVRALIPLLQPCTKHTLRGAVIRVARQAGVKKISSHDLRRTYISLGCEEPIDYTEELMLRLTDHKSKSQLGRIYNKTECLKMMPNALVMADYISGLMGLGKTLSID